MSVVILFGNSLCAIIVVVIALTAVSFTMNVENRIVEKAFAILTSRLREATISVSYATLVERYLLHKLILEEREIFKSALKHNAAKVIFSIITLPGN